MDSLFRDGLLKGEATAKLRIDTETCVEILNAADDRGVNPRRRSPNVVAYYAGEMRSGRFACSTVYFDALGYLVDGQHRLAAAIKAQRDFSCWVIGGLNRDEVMGLDQGKKRGVNTYLAAEGRGNATTLQATLRLINAYLERGSLAYTGGAASLSPRRAFDLLDQSPGIDECVSHACKCASVVSAPPVAACIWLGEMQEIGEMPVGEAFAEGVASGAQLSDGDPRLALRNRMMKDKGSKTQLKAAERNALVVIAWNKWVLGQSTKLLRWHPSSPFPDVERVS